MPRSVVWVRPSLACLSGSEDSRWWFAWCVFCEVCQVRLEPAGWCLVQTRYDSGSDCHTVWGPVRRVWGPVRRVWGPVRRVWGPVRRIWRAGPDDYPQSLLPALLFINLLTPEPVRILVDAFSENGQTSYWSLRSVNLNHVSALVLLVIFSLVPAYGFSFPTRAQFPLSIPGLVLRTFRYALHFRPVTFQRSGHPVY